MSSETKTSGSIWETIKTVFWALLIALVFRTLFFPHLIFILQPHNVIHVTVISEINLFLY